MKKDKEKKMLKKFYSNFKKVNLVDRYLIVIVFGLFSYLLLILFHYRVHPNDPPIDTVIRSSLSAIFGYFLSANFLRTECQRDKKPLVDAPKKETVAIKKDDVMSDDCERSVNLQVHIIALIGICSFVILGVIRLFDWAIPLTEIITTTRTMMKDFISGSIGFLIGHVDEKKDK